MNLILFSTTRSRLLFTISCDNGAFHTERDKENFLISSSFISSHVDGGNVKIIAKKIDEAAPDRFEGKRSLSNIVTNAKYLGNYG